jgi:hypothetical protein
MSEKEINAYSLTSLEELTDEMLAYIMREVAEEAKQSNEETLERFFDEISLMYQQQYGNKKRDVEQLPEWAKQIVE